MACHGRANSTCTRDSRKCAIPSCTAHALCEPFHLGRYCVLYLHVHILYASVTRFKAASNSTPIWRLSCSSSSYSSLSSCSKYSTYSYSCTHEQDVVLSCLGSESTCIYLFIIVHTCAVFPRNPTTTRFYFKAGDSLRVDRLRGHCLQRMTRTCTHGFNNNCMHVHV